VVEKVALPTMRANDRVLFPGSSRRSRVRIRVTTGWCITDGIRYPITDLVDLGQRRASGTHCTYQPIAGLGLTLTLFALVAVAIGRRWTAEVGAAAVTFLPSSLANVLRRPYEIWAEYHRRPVSLSRRSTRNSSAASRALVRAGESLDQRSPREP
jgi:hypothetical protein